MTYVHRNDVLYWLTVAVILLSAAAAGIANDRVEEVEGVSMSAVGGEKAVAVPIALLPRAVASFGATVANNWLYVYGGHVGRKHQHSTENVTGTFYRMNLLGARNWEALPGGTGLQSVALVALDGALYRLGGMTAHNSPDEDEDMHSVDEVMRFDPERGEWTAMPSLPEGRSSHDATVLGQRIYLAGGWKLNGASIDASWHDTAWMLDLGEGGCEWTRLPDPPFQRRALALAAAGGRVFALGGMTPWGGTSSDVFVFDPERRAWTEGPTLPFDGFGLSATGVGDRVFVSGRSGRVYQLRVGADEWEPVTRLTFPRIFHRLVAAGADTLYALGGAARGGHIRQLERIALERRDDAERPAIASWTIPYPGAVKNRAGMFLHENALYFFGGNNSLGQHDFAPENFLDEGYRVHLGSLQVEAAADFPVQRQSMHTLVVDAGSTTGLAIGGFGHNDEDALTQPDVFGYDFRSDAWRKLSPGLPNGRTQFGLIEWDDKLWVFGGLDFDPTKEGAARFMHHTAILHAPVDGEQAAFEPSSYELPRPRRAFGGALLDGCYYLVGGMREGFQPVEVCDVFDLRDHTWTTIPAPARHRISPELVALDGCLYLGGGVSRDESGSSSLNRTLERFDPEQGEWDTVVDEIPQLRRHVRMTTYGDALLLASHQDADARSLMIQLIRP